MDTQRKWKKSCIPKGPTFTLRIMSMLGSITKVFQSPAKKKVSARASG